MDNNEATQGVWRAHSRQDAAAILGVPVRQIDAAIRRGELPAFKVGKHVRITDEALRVFAGMPEVAA